jgi:hypothetical protein
MSVIPCKKNAELRHKIEAFAEKLKTEAHTIGDHGLSENEFYDSGLFRGAIERVRGQFSATTRPKREFTRHILNYMQDQDHIDDWESTGEDNRHDYSVTLKSGKIAIIELKGCLDGNNTNIFERPSHAQEFILWSLCTNSGADPRHNAWSGIHTRLSAEIISKGQVVDGLVIWDMACGTIGRPCPKISTDSCRSTTVGPYVLPPPCVYLMPGTIPSPRNNPHPDSQALEDVEFLRSLVACFNGKLEEVSYVDFKVGHQGAETVRTTRITRGGVIQKESGATPIRRA